MYLNTEGNNLIATGFINCSCQRFLFVCPKEVLIYTFSIYMLKIIISALSCIVCQTRYFINLSLLPLNSIQSFQNFKTSYKEFYNVEFAG